MSEQDLTPEEELEEDQIPEEEEETLEETPEETPEETEEEEEDEDKVKLERENAKLRRLLKKKPKKQTNQAELDDDIKEDVKYLKLSEKKREFGYAHGLSPEATDKVFSINAKPDAETLKDPFIVAGLKAIERKQKVSANTPSSSAKATIGKAGFNELSDADKQIAYEKYMNSKRK